MSAINPLDVTALENSFSLTIGEDFCIDRDPDVIEQLLADMRSPNTKRAYSKDLKNFFLFVAGQLPDRNLVL